MATASESDGTYVLVTGANSGLGFAICCRLIDEFLYTRAQSEQLHLIITTRDTQKGDDTVRRLREHLHKTLKRADHSLDGVSKLLEPRVHFHREVLELTSLISVREAAKRLLVTLPKLDAILLNAGIAGISGIKWPLAIWKVLTDVKEAINRPSYKKTRLNWTTKPQKVSLGDESGDGKLASEHPLGQIFCANIFGHYLLTHYLAPLLAKATPGRIIWISSIEAHPDTYTPPDIQAISSKYSYESSKRVTDIMALTGRLPSTTPWVDHFLSHRPSHDSTSYRPKTYLCHPGIIGTNIVPLPSILLTWLFMLVVFFNRIIGNCWAIFTAYKGACAPVWLALSPQETLDAMEKWGGVAKWGSATDTAGNERVQRTEVEGWGFGGKVDDRTVRAEEMSGRRPGAKNVTREGRVHFEEMGREIWRELELLRVKWEEWLGPLGMPAVDDIDE